MWNSKLKAVLMYTDSFFITDLTQTLQKCEQKLRDLNHLLATLAHKKVVEHGMEITILNTVGELSKIREVAVIHSKADNSKQKDEIIISKMSPPQKNWR